jgi:regulator of extracellular matrix RemA (YlzA/DUF370 family)
MKLKRPEAAMMKRIITDSRVDSRKIFQRAAGRQTR